MSAEIFKRNGNAFFKEERYWSAQQEYSEGITQLIQNGSPESQIDLFVELLNQRATCYLNLGDFERCIGDCRYVLIRDPDNRESIQRLCEATDKYEERNRSHEWTTFSTVTLGDDDDDVSDDEEAEMSVDENPREDQPGPNIGVIDFDSDFEDDEIMEIKNEEKNNKEEFPVHVYKPEKKQFVVERKREEEPEPEPKPKKKKRKKKRNKGDYELQLEKKISQLESQLRIREDELERKTVLLEKVKERENRMLRKTIKNESLIKNLQQKVDGLTEEKICAICYENNRNTAMIPCGHTLCGLCYVRVCNERKECVCPFCRTRVLNGQHFY